MDGSDSVWWKRVLRRLEIGFAWLLLGVTLLWAMAALYFDLFPRLHLFAPIVYLVVLVALAYFARRQRRRMGVCLAGFLLVLACWLSLKPSNDRRWQSDDAETPWAEIDGNRATIHNFRNWDYRSLLVYTCAWLTKTVYLS